MLEGHKASFCLEDRECNGETEAKYDCENYGDQGITPGCKDIYHANIDCQWLDVTDLDLGTYLFKMEINPQYKVCHGAKRILSVYLYIFVLSGGV